MTDKKPAAAEKSTANDPAVLADLSRDAAKSTYKPHPDPNPDGVHPAPGPQVEQHLGKP